MIADYLFMFAWGLCVLAAFVGWGGVVVRTLGTVTDDVPVDWGLQAGWGMALLLLMGGLLSLLELVSPALMIGLTLAGLVMWFYDIWKTRSAISAPDRYKIILLICILIPLISRYAAAVHFTALSCGDDDIAYFPFIARLLDTGTLIDPFSLRRLAAYGGQTFLQALVGAVGTEENAFLVDRGIAVIISFGLTLGFFHDRTKLGILPYALTMLVIMVLPFPMLNSASHITGLALFLTLFRTLQRLPGSAMPNARTIWLIAMIVAGAASLRAHFLVAAALAVACYWLTMALQNRNEWKQSVLALTRIAGATIVCLLAWMVLLYRSSNSFLYPLIRGNHRVEFENYSASLDFDAHFQIFANILLDAKLLVFMVPVGLFLFRRSYPAALSLYIGALITTAAMAWVFTHSDVDNIHRYVAPFLNAAFIATVVSFARDARTPTSSSGMSSLPVGDKIIGGVMLVLLPFMMSKDVERLTDRWGKVGLGQAERALYREIQASVPKGKKFMAVVNHPYAFDYALNDVSTIDVAGAASPDPGVPYFKGAQAFKAYFLNMGIPYLVVGNFDQPGACLYNRRLWKFHLSRDIPVWQMGAKYYLDLMDNLGELKASEEVIFQKNGFTVLELKPDGSD